MQIRILGCSGGIGAGLRTTSILVDEDVLIDVGTGVGDLTLEELSRIRHVFLTHAHLDHIASLPMLLDTLFDRFCEEPLKVYGRIETLDALRRHIFNDVIWPDFTMLPAPDRSVIELVPISPGTEVTLGARRLRAIDVQHAVPTMGYCVANGVSVFAFSGDTMSNRTLWPVLNSYDRLDVLVVEVSFPDRQAALAASAGHYCPSTLAEDLKNLDHEPDLWVTAMKPGEEDNIFAEVTAVMPQRDIRCLQSGIVFDL